MYPASVVSYGKPVTIIPVADIHAPAGKLIGSWDEEKFKDYLEWAVTEARGTHPIWLILGDIIDLGTPSNRELIRHLYKEAQEALDNAALHAVNRVVSLMKQFVKNSSGLFIRGHHGIDLSTGKHRGKNSDEVFAELLGFDYCGLTSAMLTINLNKGRSRKIRNFNVYASHGSGSGNAVNKVKKLNQGFDNVDLFLQDHTHQLCVDTIPRRNVNGEELLGRMAMVMICGTWDSGYQLSKTDEHYAETRQYPPNWVGGGVIRVEVGPKDFIRVSPRTMSLCR